MTAALALARRHGALAVGGLLLAGFVLLALCGPWLGGADAQAMLPGQRLRAPSALHWFGSDRLGRDVFARVVHGSGASLAVGLAVALLSGLVGTLLGLLAGYVRWLDGIIMRVMDGVMAIPGIMVAIALVSVLDAGLGTVIAAIGINDIPRVARLVRGALLSLREEPYVEAATMLGTSGAGIVFRHMLPGVLAPLAVLCTHIAASAMLLEATLSFLGLGLPPDIPSWGNIMADGRTLFRVAPWIILFPGLTLASAVFAINLLGDGLQDALEARRG